MAHITSILTALTFLREKNIHVLSIVLFRTQNGDQKECVVTPYCANLLSFSVILFPSYACTYKVNASLLTLLEQIPNGSQIYPNTLKLNLK